MSTSAIICGWYHCLIPQRNSINPWNSRIHQKSKKTWNGPGVCAIFSDQLTEEVKTSALCLICNSTKSNCWGRSSTALGMCWNILKPSCPCQNDSRFDDLSSVSHCLWHEPWSLIYKQVGHKDHNDSSQFKFESQWQGSSNIIYKYIQKWLNHVEYSILFTCYISRKCSIFMSS